MDGIQEHPDQGTPRDGIPLLDGMEEAPSLRIEEAQVAAARGRRREIEIAGIEPEKQGEVRDGAVEIGDARGPEAHPRRPEPALQGLGAARLQHERLENRVLGRIEGDGGQRNDAFRPEQLQAQRERASRKVLEDESACAVDPGAPVRSPHDHRGAGQIIGCQPRIAPCEHPPFEPRDRFEGDP